MPLPGGPPDKFGNRYENWWAVSQLVRILLGGADSIRIETPGITKAEFVVIANGMRELHQAKINSQDGKWSLTSLRELLQGIFSELSGDDAHFVFVSGSDAPELRELIHRAVNAESVEEFESRFLVAKTHSDNFNKLKKYWQGTDTPTAYALLRKMEIRTIDEQGIEDKVRNGLRSLILMDHDSICNELRTLTTEYIHKTVAREELVAHLGQKGFILRHLTNENSAASLIAQAADRYLENGRKKLIRGKLIPRSATQDLLKKFEEAESGCDFVITGKAGSGKTGCVIELVESLQLHGTPVLAFRLDRLEPLSKTSELGKQLSLEESPAFVLATAAESHGNAVLVVDQLDALSTASGRNSSFFDVVQDLLEEARGFRPKLKMHVVVVCRTFDLENDSRLRRMLSEKRGRVDVLEFTLDELKAVLTAENYDVALFHQRQLALLQLPQNLSLFLDSRTAKTKKPVFNTAKELFDCYWDTKRQAVTDRALHQHDLWLDVIQLLCKEMVSAQQLSVPREKLDKFAVDYIDQMASEGVLSFDSQRYGFGHESFFDYCFARTFIGNGQELSEFLTSSEQHLFLRAQVRQVLAYLRESDRVRYCTDLSAILTDSRIRTHIKDLALAVLMNVPDPDDTEWAILEPNVTVAIDAIVNSKQHGHKFEIFIWQHFFFSSPWFDFINEKGIIENWLASDNDGIVNIAVNYIGYHQRHAGERVAQLLEPYVGKGGNWLHRLRSLMESADYGNSRRFFELFLRLINDGTLDYARDRLASNGTFWLMLGGLVDTRPEWLPEVLAHWLRRRYVLVKQKSSDSDWLKWRELFDNDSFGSNDFHTAAVKAPEVFVTQVLPVILDIAEASVYESESRFPKLDAVWPIMSDGQYESVENACRNSLINSLETIAKTDPEKLRSVIFDLSRRETYISSFLLVKIYTAGAIYFANEAVELLCNQPWRLDCGYSNSPYWASVELIKATFPHTTRVNQVKLIDSILVYLPEYERSKDGFKWAGRASRAFLSVIPPDLLTANARSRYQELERKFGSTETAPTGISVQFVDSPIKREAVEKMSDDQWLKAIAKYDSERPRSGFADWAKGGSWQLASVLRESTINEPERFARLALMFPADTNPSYFDRLLNGLKETSVSTELRLAVCSKAFNEHKEECGKVIADVLGTIEEQLPDEFIKMLTWLATEHPDPEKELWSMEATGGKPFHGGNILEYGINTARGRAALAISELINSNPDYIQSFHAAIKRLVEDQSVSVRSCAAHILLVMIRFDHPLAMELFHKLVKTDERLLQTPYVDQFIYYSLRKYFNELRPVIKKMLDSKEVVMNKAGAQLASLALLMNQDQAYLGLFDQMIGFVRKLIRIRPGERLVSAAMRGNVSHRKGVAVVATANIGETDCREWSVLRLATLFNDADPDVCREAASCFRNMKNKPLENYERLIQQFCDSSAFREDSHSILHALEESSFRLPGLTIFVCDKFFTRFSGEARDVRTHRAADVYTLVKLVFRTYQQHQNDEWASQCLNLIDRMCLEGIHSVRSGLEDFER